MHIGQGAIIGQFLIDGEQVKGEVSSSFTEVVTAAERDATDRINRNRIPRQYHKAVKEYFSSVQKSMRRSKTSDPGESPKASDNSGEKESKDRP